MGRSLACREFGSMRNALFLLAAVIAVLLIVAFYPGGGGGASSGPAAGAGPAALVGAPAASFPAKRLDGRPDSLERYRGQIVLVNLWASWCEPCRAEMADLERLYEQNARHGVVVLGIDQGESASVAAAFTRSRGVRFPILLDEDQRYGRAYAAVGLPTTLIVDRSGRVVRGIDGALTLAQMRDALAPALRRAPAGPP